MMRTTVLVAITALAFEVLWGCVAAETDRIGTTDGDSDSDSDSDSDTDTDTDADAGTDTDTDTDSDTDTDTDTDTDSDPDCTVPCAAGAVFINEIHYDNDGTDVDE